MAAALAPTIPADVAANVEPATIEGVKNAKTADELPAIAANVDATAGMLTARTAATPLTTAALNTPTARASD